jgi:hypothetical protein
MRVMPLLNTFHVANEYSTTYLSVPTSSNTPTPWSIDEHPVVVLMECPSFVDCILIISQQQYILAVVIGEGIDVFLNLTILAGELSM